jgi:hypothetical protein
MAPSRLIWDYRRKAGCKATPYYSSRHSRSSSSSSCRTARLKQLSTDAEACSGVMCAASHAHLRSARATRGKLRRFRPSIVAVKVCIDTFLDFPTAAMKHTVRTRRGHGDVLRALDDGDPLIFVNYEAMCDHLEEHFGCARPHFRRCPPHRPRKSHPPEGVSEKLLVLRKEFGALQSFFQRAQE